jgi:hypothetical protein
MRGYRCLDLRNRRDALLPPLRGKVGKGGDAAPGLSAESLRLVSPPAMRARNARPPFLLRLSSLRSLSLRCLPPQGGKGNFLRYERVVAS